MLDVAARIWGDCLGDETKWAEVRPDPTTIEIITAAARAALGDVPPLESIPIVSAEEARQWWKTGTRPPPH